MKKATVYFPPTDLQRDAWSSHSARSVISAYLAGRSIVAAEVPVGDRKGQEAAEECFDLTNNPSRQDERESSGYGRKRSLSVGDIVKTDEGDFLCASVGWVKVDVPAPAKATKPSDYLHILAWGRQLRSSDYYIRQQQYKAFKAGAPIDAIFERHASNGSGPTGEWAVVGGCAPEVRDQVNRDVEYLKESLKTASGA